MVARRFSAAGRLIWGRFKGGVKLRRCRTARIDWRAAGQSAGEGCCAAGGWQAMRACCAGRRPACCSRRLASCAAAALAAPRPYTPHIYRARHGAAASVQRWHHSDRSFAARPAARHGQSTPSSDQIRRGAAAPNAPPQTSYIRGGTASDHCGTKGNASCEDARRAVALHHQRVAAHVLRHADALVNIHSVKPALRRVRLRVRLMGWVVRRGSEPVVS